MGGVLLVNPRAGKGGVTPNDLRREAAALGVDVHVLTEGEKLDEVARSAGATVLGIAGGDGSLGVVASVAIEQDVPFVCIPFGTRNHFARDLGLDRDDPIGALAAFAGEERRIDVARVGDRVFLNNASLGLYAELVDRVERHRRRRAAFARLRSLGLLARHRRPLSVTIDGEEVDVRILLIANNSYELSAFQLGERKRLDEGFLHAYLATGALPSNWRVLEARTEFEVGSARARLRVALDGYPTELESPLRFTVDPKALRVLVPPSP